jgi:SAM-dependent MidA family methyltransferase
MELMLYHPEHGYYGPAPRKLGRGGDFFTSVSVGPLYGRLLAQLARQQWEKIGSPADFTLVEQGAHDGRLARDILDALDIPGARYAIVEPNPRYRETQRATTADARVKWLDNIAQIPASSFYLCNELPDAFPVHLARFDGQTWHELLVDADLQLVPAPASSPALAAELEKLPRDLETGHVIEINLAMLAWMRALAAAAPRAGIFIADYGLDEDEFRHRPTGTLRRYFQHQTDDRYLEDPGLCDLTTHVNFTRLIAEASAHGLRVDEYDLQGRFLTRLAAPWLRSLEGHGLYATTLRQFQSLTHPAIMGRSFRCLLLETQSAP